MRGFLCPGELYAQETGLQLLSYSIVIHESGLVVVEKPNADNPLNDGKVERSRMANLLGETIKTTYRKVTEIQVFEPV
jgi:hypothetical protein